LGEPPEKFGDLSEIQYTLSPRNRQAIRADDIDLRGYVESMHDRIQGIMGRLSTFGRMFLQ